MYRLHAHMSTITYTHMTTVFCLYGDVGLVVVELIQTECDTKTLHELSVTYAVYLTFIGFSLSYTHNKT